MTEIREVLRAWLASAGLRQVAAQAGVDRKTARRYVAAAVEAGLARDGGVAQLTDELVGQVAEVVRPVRPGGHGRAWDQLEACRAEIEAQVKAGLSVVKIGDAAGSRRGGGAVPDAAPVLRGAVRVRAHRIHGAGRRRGAWRGVPFGLAVGILEVGLAVLVEGADALDSIGMDGRAPVGFHHDRDGLLDRFALAHPDRLLDGLYCGG